MIQRAMWWGTMVTLVPHAVLMEGRINLITMYSTVGGSIHGIFEFSWPRKADSKRRYIWCCLFCLICFLCNIIFSVLSLEGRQPTHHVMYVHVHSD